MMVQAAQGLGKDSDGEEKEKMNADSGAKAIAEGNGLEFVKNLIQSEKGAGISEEDAIEKVMACP